MEMQVHQVPSIQVIAVPEVRAPERSEPRKKNTLLCVEKSAEAEVAYDGCFADRTGTPLPADVKSQDGTSNRPDGMIIL